MEGAGSGYDSYHYGDINCIPLPAPELMVYLGKGIEFFSGVCLIAGLFTRVASLLMAFDMRFICFKIGNGKLYDEDQHPFLFALLAAIFFFTGPVRCGLDLIVFNMGK
jgi:putative oxidoreductase